MAVTLGEEVTLLALDDESGAAKGRSAAGWAAAGGILLELTLAGRLAVTDGRLTVPDSAPTGDTLLDGRLGKIVEWLGRDAKGKIGDWLAKDQPKAFDAAVERLCERGVVTEHKRRTLGIFTTRRYPEVDGSAERELRHRLEDVVRYGAEPDERTTGLIALLHAAGLHGVAFPGVPRKQVAPRMEAIAEGQWVADDVRQAIENMQAVLVAVTVATTTATTVATM
ncbi:GPP34 family phosphoprotein [Streptomyces smyrnaeus]|uniref:GOLPH3/VPS74 family protein n=1 Tax=Streptomyces TaxID=1883 RepID=UPI000C1995D9|nr:MULTISPECIES: GPP34 family phosphoprotein [unclassified Streptomyces]MBQ0864000.1 GPP34 family phosphoprotein [Streptomyces sp. RK75]MBQ1120034.1 GPP34 family phosphoprotein [Streptomyces sp. B15]MBQ1159424.1 GPP34 family phosphoprotein [Streptomyces sp. A73]